MHILWKMNIAGLKNVNVLSVRILAGYLGKVSEFLDEDMCSYYVPDDVVWKGKKAICDYLGLKADETEIYDEHDELVE